MKDGWTMEEGGKYLEYFKQYLTCHPIVNSKMGKGSGWRSTNPDEKVPRLWIRLRIDVEFSEIGHIDIAFVIHKTPLTGYADCAAYLKAERDTWFSRCPIECDLDSVMTHEYMASVNDEIENILNPRVEAV